MSVEQTPEEIQQSLDKYGDESDWDWEVFAKFLCRVIRRGDGLLASQLIADLKNNQKTCPLSGVTKKIKTPHPGSNISGRVAARNFPDACGLCKIKANWSDFKIEKS